MKTLVIAEVGVNHNGSMEIAKKLIDVASESGANIVKFQTFTAEKLVKNNAPRAQYQIDNTDKKESQFEMLKKLEMTKENFIELNLYCSQKKIEFLSTGFDIESINFLVDLGIKRIKIPSGEINNLPLLRHISSFDLPIILSTGMSSLEEVKETVQFLIKEGVSKKNLIILHCTSQYPAPLDSVNLRAMLTIKEQLHIDIGYSDHTLNFETPIAAVSMGAKIIEKHFTLSRSMDGPDHPASLEPQDLKSMIESIRNTELLLGSKEKKPTEIELQTIKVARKSIVAKKIIPHGKTIEESDIDTKRPGDGVSPMHWDTVIGSTAKKKYKKDEQIII
jgi:N,N'-diacetyllegionaminate synthase